MAEFDTVENIRKMPVPDRIKAAMREQCEAGNDPSPLMVELIESGEWKAWLDSVPYAIPLPADPDAPPQKRMGPYPGGDALMLFH